MTLLEKIGDWFDSAAQRPRVADADVAASDPAGAAGPMGWWYIFGSASLTLLMLQVLTGIGLALGVCPVGRSGVR